MSESNVQVILAVDDELRNLQLLRAHLEPRGYRVLTAQNGAEALQMLKHYRVDLVLLDVMMPGMDGYQVCRIIKRDAASASVPVVFITALQATEQRILGIEAGGDDFISKPFSGKEVLARVKSLISKKAAADGLRSSHDQMVGLTQSAEFVMLNLPTQQSGVSWAVEVLAEKLLTPTGHASKAPAGVLVMSLSGENTLMRLPGRTTYPCCAGELRRLLGRLSSLQPAAVLAAGDLSRLEAEEREVLKCVGIADENLIYYRSGDYVVAAWDYNGSVSELDLSVLRHLGLEITLMNAIEHQMNEVEKAFVYLTNALARAAEASDPETGSHISRLNEYSWILAKAMSLPEDFCRTIHYSAQMHDVGKVHVHPDVLKKPGELTTEEFDLVKLHTLYGARILGDSKRLTMSRRIALSHHERWDGTGYPYGLKGEAIPLEGRIVNIVDQYDALRSIRPYKEAFSHNTAVKIILEGDGRTEPCHFDPRVLQTFTETASRLEEIFESSRQ